uniref:Protection of telomeres protein 1 n=1 Tax=Sinocyclocheilus grahami TaxID=75366 RepID=A0A672MHV6_SINGR
MPVQKVKDSSDLDAKVPSHLQRTSITSLTITSEPSHRCVKARVVHIGPVISCAQKDGIEMLRAELKEEDPLQRTAEHTSINVIFFGTLAKDFSQSARQGDVVLLADFTIKKSPSFLRDKLHPCQLEMDGKDDCVYVSGICFLLEPLLKTIFLALISFFSLIFIFSVPHYLSLDYCSTLKITDQSDVKVGCNIFSKKLEDHPVIFRVGDIIRLHRFKTEMFRDSMSLLNTYGWSTVTFDGTIDSPVVPHTSRKLFHFGESDIRTVQELRQWAANQSWISNDLTVSLSSVKPGMYFDLTCQLLAKAVMDSRCILLKVWDGTKCQHPLLNVAVASDALEGESTVAKDRMNLTANVLVYDNHLEVARDLKPGTFLCFYNLHALLQRAPDQLPDQLEHLSFHLHGGTSYGRGLRSLPAESPALQSFKSVLEKHVDLDEYDEVNDGTLLEIWYTPPEAVDAEADTGPSYTVRTCEHNMRRLTLARVKRSTSPLLCHVRARVKKYNPQQLYQCLKLFCSNFHRCLCHTALGVQLMQYRLLIQFELEDQTDTLEALLWENAERFFHVSAVDASGSQDLQDKIQTIMDTIQPPDSSLEERPWLDLCVSVYTVKDNDRNRVCYQITNTEIKEE